MGTPRVKSPSPLQLHSANVTAKRKDEVRNGNSVGKKPGRRRVYRLVLQYGCNDRIVLQYVTFIVNCYIVIYQYSYKILH